MMTDFPGIQPNEIEFEGHTISYQYAAAVKGTMQESVVVFISPGAIESVDVVMGLGRNYYEAKADAFERAKKLITGNSGSADTAKSPRSSRQL